MKQINTKKSVLLIAIGLLSVGCSSNAPIGDRVLYGKKPLIVCKETHTYKHVGDLDIKADVFRFLDDRIRPVVVFIHGGALMFDNREWLNSLAHQISIERGNVLISIDYRLAPETKIQEIAEDVEDAIDWVRRTGPKKFNVDPNQIVVMGVSAGGYLALLCGHRVTPPPVAIVSFCGYCELIGDWISSPQTSSYWNPRKYTEEEALNCIDPEGPAVTSRKYCAEFEYYCMQTGQYVQYVSGFDPKVEPENLFPFMPLRNISPAFPPTILIHGDADPDVPFEQAQLMADELDKHNVPHELVRVKGGTHDGFESIKPKDRADAYDRVVEFVLQRLTNLDPNLNPN